MTSITGAIAKIKDDPKHLLDQQTIHEACHHAGYTWRNRTLDPVPLIRLFILQVLNGNIACQGLRNLSDLEFTATAYCRARSRLPLEVYQWLCRSFIDRLRSTTEDVAAAGGWLGHRLFRVDGTGISMPDTPELHRHFGQPGAMKEMLIFVIVYNMVRLVMLRSAQQQGVEPDRISFIDTLRWICSASPGKQIPVLVINPYRRGRHQPRVIKRRKDRYPHMTRPRQELLQLLFAAKVEA